MSPNPVPYDWYPYKKRLGHRHTQAVDDVKIPEEDRHQQAKVRTSLVAQWLRIRLPMQGIWVRSLVWEDPTCCRAGKPVHHNY